MLEDHSYISTKNIPTPIHPQNIQVTLSEEKIPSPKYLSKLVNNNKTLNLNSTSYYLNVLASPDESTWSTTGVPIKKQ